jgi:hypothetical protein
MDFAFGSAPLAAPRPLAPVITTSSVPGATQDTAYSQQLAADNIVTAWTLESGTLPAGDTISSPETGLQGRHYGTLLKITNAGKIVLSQVLFADDTAALRGRTVRLQCWLKASTGTPTLNIALAQLTNAGTVDSLPATFISAFGANATDPTLGTNLAYIAPKTGVTPDNGTVDGNHVELAATTSWQRVGAVFDVPSNCKHLVVLIYGDSQFATSAGFSVSQVSLTDGMEVQDWAPLDRATERGRCTEVFKTLNDDVNPVTSAGLDTGEFKFPCPVGAAAAFTIGFRLPEAMRAAPNPVTLLNPSAANLNVRNVTDGADCSSAGGASNGHQGITITATSNAGAAVGEHMAVHILAEAFL